MAREYERSMDAPIAAGELPPSERIRTR
jgi:hypothetical protein